VANRKTLKKIVFSAAAALVLLGSVYFLLDKSLMEIGDLLTSREEVGPRNLLSRDLIGRTVELEKRSLSESIARNLARQLAHENEKLDSLFESVEPSDFMKSRRTGTSNNLLSFMRSNPSIDRMRIINDRYEILFSTSEGDIAGSRLDAEVYGVLFGKHSAGESKALADEVMQSIVLYRLIGTDHALLVYYRTDFLESVFARAPGFTYQGAILTSDKVVILNFPEFDEREAENLANLSRTIREERSGFLRVKRDELDKTVYFLPGAEGISDWIVGVAFDTAGVQISFIGAIILIVQALVVAAIIIFILSTVRDRKRFTPQAAPAEKPSRVAAPAAGPTLIGEPGTDTRGIPITDTAQEGVVSLKDVEEIVELAEVGEAEVTEEYEGGEALLTMHGTEGGGERQEEPLPHTEELHGAEIEGVAEAATADEPGRSSNGSKSVPLELSEDEELEKLEAVQREIMGPEAQMLEEIDELDELAGEEEEVDESIIDDLIGAGDTLPELESLVKAEGIEQRPDKDRLATGPEKLYTEKAKVRQDEELAHLIQRIGEDDRTDRQIDVKDQLEHVLDDLGLLKGAILLREGERQFRPVTFRGLTPGTIKRLFFTDEEKLVKNILAKNKILYVKSNAFIDNELRNKFDLEDSSTIRSMYFVPFMSSGKELAGFLIVSLTMSELADPNLMLKKIKEVKKKLTKII